MWRELKDIFDIDGSVDIEDGMMMAKSAGNDGKEEAPGMASAQRQRRRRRETSSDSLTETIAALMPESLSSASPSSLPSLNVTRCGLVAMSVVWGAASYWALQQGQ